MILSEHNYTKETIIEWHDCDIRNELRPYAFMNLTQEIAGWHANQLGFGYENLIKEDHVWVLSRYRVKYLKYPKWGEKMLLETWHKGMLSLFGLRDFVLHDSTGERAIVATSSWLIMNINTRKIDRSSVYGSNAYKLSTNTNSHAIEEPCQRLKRVQDLNFLRSHTVCYSDIDFNGHANNAKYIEWITDSIELDFLKTHRISEFQINFNAETKYGEQIDIYSKENVDSSQQTLFFEGRRGADIVFESQFSFIPC